MLQLNEVLEWNLNNDQIKDLRKYQEDHPNSLGGDITFGGLYSRPLKNVSWKQWANHNSLTPQQQEERRKNIR